MSNTASLNFSPWMQSDDKVDNKMEVCKSRIRIIFDSGSSSIKKIFDMLNERMLDDVVDCGVVLLTSKQNRGFARMHAKGRNRS